MLTRNILFFPFVVVAFNVFAQFPGAVGTANTTAIHKDSSDIIGWATGCTVVRGYMDVSNPGLGFATYGTENAAIGPADGTDIVSLGDGGIATLTFAQPITDEAGFDFAVFENSFNDNFLELALVSVSSDGIQFFVFPATSNTQAIDQIGPFDDVTDASELNNLAGKYRAEYGTPFDLAELSNTPGLDIYAVTHVRIVDAVGSIDHTYATFDQFGIPVNDPFPTPFPSGGFDLDAIGVMHQLPAGVSETAVAEIMLYPNPVRENSPVLVRNGGGITHVCIFDCSGKIILEGDSIEVLSNHSLRSGIYSIQFKSHSGNYTQQLAVIE